VRVTEADRTARLLRRAAAAVAVVGIVVLVIALVQRGTPVVTAKNLAPSVENATGSLGLEPTRCTRTSAHEWQCVVSENGSGGDATYRVHVKPDACWTATRIAENVSEQHMASKASGCVTR
jgi:hypothetical protein